MKGVTFVKRRKVEFSKPNMCNLRGRTGRAVMEAIRSSKAPDLTELRKEVNEFKKRILAEEQNDSGITKWNILLWTYFNQSFQTLYRISFEPLRL